MQYFTRKIGTLHVYLEAPWGGVLTSWLERFQFCLGMSPSGFFGRDPGQSTSILKTLH